MKYSCVNLKTLHLLHSCLKPRVANTRVPISWALLALRPLSWTWETSPKSWVVRRTHRDADVNSSQGRPEMFWILSLGFPYFHTFSLENEGKCLVTWPVNWTFPADFLPLVTQQIRPWVRFKFLDPGLIFSLNFTAASLKKPKHFSLMALYNDDSESASWSLF